MADESRPLRSRRNRARREGQAASAPARRSEPTAGQRLRTLARQHTHRALGGTARFPPSVSRAAGGVFSSGLAAGGGIAARARIRAATTVHLDCAGGVLGTQDIVTVAADHRDRLVAEPAVVPVEDVVVPVSAVED